MTHPSDDYSRAVAHTNNADALTDNFEKAVAHADPSTKAGGLEVVAAVAVARVRLLERLLAAQEETVRARLFERTGNVTLIKPKDKTK